MKIKIYIYDLSSYALKNISLFTISNDVHFYHTRNNTKITQISFYSVDEFLLEDILKLCIIN